MTAPSRELRGRLDGRGLRCAIAVSRFNAILTERLLAGARGALLAHGVEATAIDVAWTPGAFELPAAARALARSGRYQVLIALGAVIRGDTPHFDHVCNQAAAGLARVALDDGVPLGFGVLTLESLEQGFDRAGGKAGNKGEEAALAALEMASLLRQIGEQP